ncbi:MAG: 23S rRNA (uracil(1939)-C(5))-methyltransferase RlmD [Deltaproteobacteria bacterium]
MVTTCRHYGECGGCDFRELDYAAQLDYKTTYCRNLFASFGCTPDPIVASPRDNFFRNKMEFTVSGSLEKPVIGQRVKDRFDKVVNLEECPLFAEDCPSMLAAVRQWLSDTDTPPYDVKKQTGELRYVSLRHSKSSGGYLVTIVACLSDKAFEGARARYVELGERLSKIAQVESFYVSLNVSRSDTAVSGKLVLLKGKEFITEKINGVEYIIRPETFFQTNPGCCERLYAKVLEFLGADTEQHIYDVYCGSGGIALQLANAKRRVTGIDISPRNIEAARENCKHNKLKAEFFDQDADEFISQLKETDPWSLIVDPPRNGLTKKFIGILEASGPGQFVYVSCNPLKLREDLKKLVSYQVARIVPVDMFPHTRHIEVVAALKRK